MPAPVNITSLKMKNNREAQLAMVIGTNGTGKTTLLKKIVINALKHNERVLIVTPDYVEWLQIDLVHEKHTHHMATYKGARRIIYQNDATLEAVIKHFHNGLLIYDDCRSYFRSNIGEKIREQFIRRRQHMLDIFFVGHGFTEIPPVVFTFANTVYLFRTRDNIKRRAEYIQDFDMMQQKQIQINEIAVNKPHYFEIIPQ